MRVMVFKFVKTIIPHLSLLGILAEESSYPHFPKKPFREDKKALSRDKETIEKEIAKTARKVRHDAKKIVERT